MLLPAQDISPSRRTPQEVWDLLYSVLLQVGLHPSNPKENNMKRFVLAIALACALSSTAFAGLIPSTDVAGQIPSTDAPAPQGTSTSVAVTVILTIISIVG